MEDRISEREKSLGDLCIIQGKVNSDLKEWE